MFGTKFRPLDFKSVYGLENIKEILCAYVRTGEYDSAYLFEGEYSSGKTTLARLFARSILCQNRREDMSPCNECFSCKEFLQERNPAYIEIDAANSGTKERIQEMLESLSYESVASKRIIFLDEAHEISKAGKDSLLLRLERQDENVIFIFGTTELNKMSPALKSRCVEFHLPLPTEELIQSKLEEICEIQKIPYTQDGLHILVRSANRHYRDAEINLGVVSKLGDVSVENVEKVVTYYDKELAYLLSTLPYDLPKVMKAADYLAGRMNIRDIYHGILRLLVDSIKLSQGLSFGSEEYNQIVGILAKQYGRSAFEVIDYLMARQRLVDLTVFHSDLLVLHYKFLEDHFAPKSSVAKKEDVSQEKKTDKSDLAKNLQYINSRPPWERESLVRELKAKKLREEKDDRTEERVSSEWGFDESADSAPDKKAVLKGVFSKQKFGEALKESLDEGKI